MNGYPQQWGASTMYAQQQQQPTAVEEVRSLWIGDLQYWVDESYLHSCFAATGEVVSVKIIRNKITGHPEGYGFVEFVSHAAAERILQTYNGTQMPGTEQCFRINWASIGSGERRVDAGPEHSIFVGDLSPDVTDYLLQETFRAQYPSVKGAKVVTDPNTGRSKGYGFVKFADETERNRALTEMNGVYCSSRPMRISQATPKKTAVTPQQYPTSKVSYQVPSYGTEPVQTYAAEADASNATAAYYGYGQGYDPYSYTASQDPSLYGYGAYATYGAYHQQVEGVHDMAAVAGVAQPLEQREDTFDPLAVPDVNKLNAAYLAVHQGTMLGRPLWLRTSSLPQQS